jgi:hypothetical protein
MCIEISGTAEMTAGTKRHWTLDNHVTQIQYFIFSLSSVSLTKYSVPQTTALLLDKI